MTKYADNFAGIRQAQADERAHPSDLGTRHFSLDALNGSWFAQLRSRITQALLKHGGLRLMQRIGPVVRLGPYYFVTRHAEIVAALHRPDVFGVPFGPEMEEMAGPPVFALGDDGGTHAAQMAILRGPWAAIDPVTHVRPVVRHVTEALLEDSGGQIDMARDVFMRVTAEACLKTFGIAAPSAENFAAFSAACSSLIFADPTGTPAVRRQAMIGAKRICDLLDISINAYANLTADERSAPEDASFLQGLMDEVAQQGPDGAVWTQSDKDTVRVILFGVITGFVPTTALAAGKILDQMRRKPDQFHHAMRCAARAEAAPDDAHARTALRDMLFEIARFNPSLFPGQFRLRKDGVDTQGLPDALRRIKPGAPVILATAVGLHDPRVVKHPNRFAPGEGFLGKDGQVLPDLSFGLGMHHCLGHDMAHEIITEAFQVILSRPGIAFLPERPKFYGPYLGRLRMRFDMVEGHQAQSTIVSPLPLKQGVDIDALRAALKGLLDEGSDLKQGLDTTGIVHFASLNLVNLGAETRLDARPTHLLAEFNTDGTQRDALARLAQMIDTPCTVLLPYLEGARGGFVAALRAHLLHPDTKPWGTIGVSFNGTEHMPVRQIEAEKELYEWAEPLVRQLSQEGTTDPVAVMTEIRQEMRKDSARAALLYRPSHRYPRFSRHKDFPFSGFIAKYAGLGLKPLAAFAVMALLLPVGLVAFGVVTLLQAADVYVSLWMVPLLLALTATGIALAWLRRVETDETPDNRYAPHDHVAAVQQMEDLPGYAQNHITSVSALKPGMLRRLTTALAFHIIKYMKILWFRPGFVTDFATIHYARWYCPKGSQKLIFQGNYDGSWESYLEDFITKVHRGQTMAWNNCAGFPRSRWFFLDGAQDGDKFKRWVRRQQVQTQFWYSRFPQLTTGMIRTNALVRDGLARALTHDECRAWANLFYTAPRPADAIETDQVQTLLFNGLGRHPLMTARVIRFDTAQGGKRFIGQLLQDARNAEVPGAPWDARLSFGDAYPDYPAHFIALSSAGLSQLGFPDTPYEGRGTLPHAFASGMTARARVLGDAGTPADPARWRWSDGSAHALLLSYARDADEQKETDVTVTVMAGHFGVTVQNTVRADVQRRGLAHSDGFGTRDGISQPIMRHTQAFAKGKAARDDVVGAGEFILGYPDSRGYLPLAITVPADTPAAAGLSSIQNPVTDLVPQFGRSELGDQRDFGRGGSFLAVRQILHNDKALQTFVSDKASVLEARHVPQKGVADAIREDVSFDIKTGGIGQGPDDKDIVTSDRRDSDVDGDMDQRPYGEVPMNPRTRQIWIEQWITAKIIGRWADGSSLARNPSVSRSVRNRARYHSLVRRYVGLRIKALKAAQGRRPSTDAELGALHRFFALTRTRSGTGRLGVDAPFGMDDTIWTAQGWTLFNDALSELEREVGPLGIPQDLLKPVRPDNDFRHGEDDPLGLYCPIGSHIRRANPRDSFRPGHEITLEINNRHRLLRRGRTYSSTFEAPQDSGLVDAGWIRHDSKVEPAVYSEEGTFFMCFNANIERQFEFVQQTWLNADGFHGGRHGPDPLITPKQQGDEFVIPGSEESLALDMCPMTGGGDTDAPVDFTRTVAGGYFFMPSKQALRYLTQL
tara:strand:+ start:1435 stop:6297 length:4863 start_codon:yes stop_codon:yes gene_type:complete